MRFNQKLAALAFATTAALVSFGAQANSVEVKVTGTITPAACTPTLSGGGTVAYGRISPSLLSDTAYTDLPDHTIPFSITCDLPTKVGLTFVDNRSGSTVSGIIDNLIGGFSGNAHNFGLGTVNTKNVGGYAMRFGQSYTADGVAVRAVTSIDSGTTWRGSNASDLGNKGATYILSWSDTNGGAPIAFKDLAGDLVVKTRLNKKADLDLSDDVDLDGSATIELVYM